MREKSIGDVIKNVFMMWLAVMRIKIFFKDYYVKLCNPFDDFKVLILFLLNDINMIKSCIC